MDDTHDYHRIFCSGCGATFDVPVSCGNRFCVTCSYQRSGRLRKKLNFLLASINPPPSYSFKFITLTLPSQSELRPMADELVRCFRRLRQRQFWLNRVRGGAHFIEVTGRPGKWHVHLHIICESRFFPVRKLSRLWQKCSPGKIVHIKTLPLGAAVNYCLKYVTKSSVSGADAYAAGMALKGMRLFQPFGSWHQIISTMPKHGYSCAHCGYDCFYVDYHLLQAGGRPGPVQVAFDSSRAPPSPSTGSQG